MKGQGRANGEVERKGIDSRPFFYPMSDMPYVNHHKADTPVTHKVSHEGINLPTFFDLTEEEIKYICDTLKSLV